MPPAPSFWQTPDGQTHALNGGLVMLLFGVTPAFKAGPAVPC
jgi:hypothetical protein